MSLCLWRRTATTCRSLFAHQSRPLLQSAFSFPLSQSLPLTTPSRAFSLIGGNNPSIVHCGNIADVKGARHVKKRVGRGPGSGHGKTSGRGSKGAGQRSGSGGQVWYEGGQTPLYKRTPKFGFKNHDKERLNVVNLGRIMQFVEAKRIDPTQVITMKILQDAGVIHRIKEGVKLLAFGKERVNVPLKLQLTYSSREAREVVSAVGGSVEHVWFNRVTLRAHLKPHKFAILPRAPGLPPPRLYWRYPHLAPPHAFKHKADEEKWVLYAKKRGLLPPDATRAPATVDMPTKKKPTDAAATAAPAAAKAKA